MPDRLRTEKAEFPQEKAKIASEVLLDCRIGSELKRRRTFGRRNPHTEHKRDLSPVTS